MRKLLAPLLLILPLGGCINLGLGTSKSPPSMLTLTAQSAPADGTTATGRLNAALSVIEPETEAKLSVLRVPVTIDPSRIAYLKKALWVERPSRLFQRLLAETLRARGNRLVTEGDTVTHGPILSGRLIDCGYDVAAHGVVVRFDAVRINPDGTIETHRFESSVTNIDADVGQVGPALNQAANQVAKAVADWIG